MLTRSGTMLSSNGTRLTSAFLIFRTSWFETITTVREKREKRWEVVSFWNGKTSKNLPAKHMRECFTKKSETFSSKHQKHEKKMVQAEMFCLQLRFKFLGTKERRNFSMFYSHLKSSASFHSPDSIDVRFQAIIQHSIKATLICLLK